MTKAHIISTENYPFLAMQTPTLIIIINNVKVVINKTVIYVPEIILLFLRRKL